MKTVECGQIFILGCRQLQKKAQHNFIGQFYSSANFGRKKESHSKGIEIGRMNAAASHKSAQKEESPNRGNFEFYHSKWWLLVTSW